MQYRSVFRAGLFEGQSVVVTGGGSGIGRCTAHELAALGAKVALVGRKPEKRSYEYKVRGVDGKEHVYTDKFTAFSWEKTDRAEQLRKDAKR